MMAWPRLAEYFARFKLSLGMTCSLEVLAPTLSRVPLWVQPATTDEIGAAAITASLHSKQNKKKSTKIVKTGGKKRIMCQGDREQDDSEKWSDNFESAIEEQESGGDTNSEASERKSEPPSRERLGIWKATQQFLGRPVNLANVAHAVVPVQAKSQVPGKLSSKKNEKSGPKLEVDVIIHGPDDDANEYGTGEGYGGPREDRDQDEDDEAFVEHQSKKTDYGEASSSASMVLVRMVNKIPLLDSAEAVACGLVQGLSSKKRMWNSFGLDVSIKHDPANLSKLPTFEVRDSEQVAPFFKKGAHNLLEDDDNSELEANGESDDEESGEGPYGFGVKRKRQQGCRRLLPASVRLGNILVIAQIHAEPTTLPLPTLSKVCSSLTTSYVPCMKC